LVDTEIEFFVRTLANLDDTLYEINSSYTKKDAAKNFDMMDMIFIMGDPLLKPWAYSTRKVIANYLKQADVIDYYVFQD
jgi:hypothetical protein